MELHNLVMLTVNVIVNHIEMEHQFVFVKLEKGTKRDVLLWVLWTMQRYKVKIGASK